MDPRKKEAAEFLESGLADDEAQALREAVARAISQRLAENGMRRLREHPQLRFNELGFGSTHGYITLPPLSD